MKEVSAIEYLKDEIEQLIEDADLKVKDIVICRNLLDESQIIITFKKEEAENR